MNRSGISLLTLFVLFACCLPLNAQTPQDSEKITFSPGPSTFLRVMGFMMENEQQGKMIVFRLEKDDYKHFIGLTPAQELHLESQIEALEKNAEEKELDYYIDQLNRWSELSPEELNKVEDEFFNFYSQLLGDANSLLRETLTPVQLQKAMEYELIAPSLISQMLDEEDLLNFSTYEALELSEEQKEKLTEIQEEIKPESDKFFKELTNMIEEFPPGKETEFSEENQMKLFEKLEKLKEKGKALTQKYQTKAGEILIQEQKDRLASLREEIPKKLASIRKELEKKAKEAPENESWKDSWKPGDPLPEGAAPPQRKPRFPFKL